MTKKDEKITLGILIVIMILSFIVNVIICINMGFAEYIAMLARIAEKTKIIC